MSGGAAGAGAAGATVAVRETTGPGADAIVLVSGAALCAAALDMLREGLG